MKRIAAAFLILSAAAVVLPAAVAAQSLDTPYRFLDYSQSAGPFGGYIWATDGRIGAGPLDAPVFGASWGIRVSGPFTFTAEVGYAPTTRIVRDTAFVEADSTWTEVGEADMNLLIGMGNLRFNITGNRSWNSIQPYLLLGGGVVTDLSGTSDVESDLEGNVRFDFGTSFAGQLGAGIDWFPTSRVSVRLGARNLLWKLSVPEAFVLTEAGRALPRSQWEQNYVATAGVFIHF